MGRAGGAQAGASWSRAARVAHLVNGIPHAEVGQAVVLDDIEQHRAVDAILDERTLVALQPEATEGLSGVRHVTVM